MSDLDIRMTEFEETQETAGFPAMLVSKDYPELCDKCRSAIDDCYSMIGEMPEDWAGDDNELPCNMAYDLRMFCGGHECINKPNQTQDSHRRNPGFCAKCGGACYFDDNGNMAETQETIPTDIEAIYTPYSVYRRV